MYTMVAGNDYRVLVGVAISSFFLLKLILIGQQHGYLGNAILWYIIRQVDGVIVRVKSSNYNNTNLICILLYERQSQATANGISANCIVFNNGARKIVTSASKHPSNIK